MACEDSDWAECLHPDVGTRTGVVVAVRREGEREVAAQDRRAAIYGDRIFAHRFERRPGPLLAIVDDLDEEEDTSPHCRLRIQSSGDFARSVSIAWSAEFFLFFYCIYYCEGVLSYV